MNDDLERLLLADAIRAVQSYGFRVVPAEPTDAMVQASIDALHDLGLASTRVDRWHKHTSRLSQALKVGDLKVGPPRATRKRTDEDVDGLLKPIVPTDLPDDVVPMEMAYRTLVAKHQELRARRRQLMAELDDTKDRSRRDELGKKIANTNTGIGELRVLARDAGELNYATVYRRVANQLLSYGVHRRIDEETHRIMGRSAHEVPRNTPTPDARFVRLKGMLPVDAS